jgi:hypothetical protein
MQQAHVRLGDVVDELHDEHGLADASTTKQSNLATTLVRSQQVDNLHSAWDVCVCACAHVCVCVCVCLCATTRCPT